jgi:hypothetical protein
MELLDIILDYYDKRGLNFPNTWESLGWANTELGEVYEQLLAKNSNWVRNNPQDHPPFEKEKFSEEISDVIMMLMVAGYNEGVNPIQSLKDKINRKLEKLNGPKE